MKLNKFLTTNVAIALGLFIFTLGYYFILSCKEYTWVFMSGDSGDWLAQARIWFLPQPYGAPVYIMLAKAVNLIGGDLAKNMVFYLSCLPSAISVILIYFAALKVKGSKLIAVVAALVMVGAFPYLAESTVVREHALAAMFISGAVLAWTYKKYPFVLMMMGLATAVNIIPLYLTVMWFLADMRKHWRDWFKWSWLFIIFGVAPYLLTLYLMEYSQYKWWQGHFSFGNLMDYLGTTGTIASLSIVDLPSRLVDWVAVFAASYGLALVPAIKALKEQWKLAVVVLAVFWLYLMDNDPTTWTFTLYAVPFMVILAAVGLKYKKEIIAVGLCACCLIGLNGFFNNAQTIDNANPLGRELYNDTMALPNGSVVITNQGGFATLGIFYAVSCGKELKLDFITSYTEDSIGYQDWLKWANETQGLSGGTSIEIAKNALNNGEQVFRINLFLPEKYIDIDKELAGAAGIPSGYVLQPYNQYYDRVVAVK